MNLNFAFDTNFYMIVFSTFLALIIVIPMKWGLRVTQISFIHTAYTIDKFYKEERSFDYFCSDIIYLQNRYSSKTIDEHVEFILSMQIKEIEQEMLTTKSFQFYLRKLYLVRRMQKIKSC
jgi:hypothetical protein